MSIIEINLSLDTDDEYTALRAWETLTRAAAGLALDDVRVEISIDRIELDDEDDDTQDQDGELADTTTDED